MMHGASGVCLRCMSGGDEVSSVCGFSCSLQDDTPVCLLGGEWNKHVYNKYTFTARLLGC